MLGLQSRLALLLVVGLLPVFALVIWSAVGQEKHRTQHASESLFAMAGLSAASVGKTVEATRQLLNAVSSVPSLKVEGLDILCTDFLKNLRGTAQGYTNLGFIGLDGNLQCGYVPPGASGYLGDRPYFRKALELDSFQMGEYQIGRLTGQASLNFGMPVRDGQGKARGVAFAALDLRQIGFDLALPQLHEMSMTLTDRNGIILATNPANSARVGQAAPYASRLAQMVGKPAHRMEPEETDGVMQFHGVAMIGTAAEPGLYVVASMPREAIIGPSRRELFLDLLVLAALAAAGLLTARWLGSRTLVIPTRKLLGEINAMAGYSGGDEAPAHRDELAGLAAAFARLAETLRLRQAERDAKELALSDTQEKLLTAQTMGKIGNWEIDLVTRHFSASDQTFEIIGQTQRPYSASFKALLKQIHPDDRARAEAVRLQFASSRETHEIELRLICPQGIRWVHLRGEPRRDGEDRVCGWSGTLQDITERVRHERMQEAEGQALKALSLGLPLSQVLEKVLLGVEMVIPGAIASANLLDEDRLVLGQSIAPSLPAEFSGKFEGLPIGEGVGSCGTAAYRRKVVIVNDISSSSLWTDYRAVAEEFSLRACWSLPVTNPAGAVVATLAVYYRECRTPEGKDIELVASAAKVVGIAIERDRKEAELRVSEARLRNTFRSAATGMAITSLKGRFVEVNESFRRMVGCDEQDIYQMDVQTLTPSADWPRIKASLDDLISGQRESLTGEERLVSANGVQIWTRASASLLRDGHGLPIAVIYITEDISQERKAKEALETAQRMLRVASRISRQGAWEMEVPGRRLTWSEEILLILDLPCSYVPTLDGALEFFVPEHRDSILQLLDACATQGTPYEAELQVVTAGGRRIWVRSFGEAVRDAAGTIVKIQGAFQDIDQSKQAELQARSLSVRLASTLENITDGFVLLDVNWTVVFANDRAALLVHRERNALVGKNHWEEFPDVVGTLVETTYRTAVAENRTMHFEFYYESLKAWFHINAYPTEEGLALYFQDITQRRQTEEQLHLLQSAVSRLNDIVLITKAEPFDNPGPQIVFVNDAFERRTGYTREEVMGKTPRILQGPKTQRHELDRIHAALKEWKPVRAELINYTKSGKEFWLELDIVPLADETGWFTHWVAVERDISERKRSQDEILQLNVELEDRVRRRTLQLESANRDLESFSYSVSHDLRSPLSTINGFAQMLLKSSGDSLDAKGKHYLSRIRFGAEQMGELIDGLLSLAKVSRDVLMVETVDLSHLAKRIARECRSRDSQRNVSVIVQPGLLVRGDAVMLMVVMQNLMGNAWKYTGRVPEARIEVGRVPCESDEAVYFVKDNGVGFDMAYVAKLFGPFQRLHSPSDFVGTGVGLANVKRVIERHGGRVWAEGKVGGGAAFYFTLGTRAV